MRKVVNAYKLDDVYSLEDIQQMVGPGWSGIITHLITDLFALGWDGIVCQVKEKFGGLRFYAGEMTDEMYKRVSQAEEESYTVCEQCGEPGRLRAKGWSRTLCYVHAKEYNYLCEEDFDEKTT